MIPHGSRNNFALYEPIAWEHCPLEKYRIHQENKNLWTGTFWSPRMFKYSWDFRKKFGQVTKPNPNRMKHPEIMNWILHALSEQCMKDPQFMGLSSHSYSAIFLEQGESRFIWPQYTFLLFYNPVSVVFYKLEPFLLICFTDQWFPRGGVTPKTHFLQFSAHGARRNFLETFIEHDSQLLNTFPPVWFHQSLQGTPVASIQNFSSATITTEWLHFPVFFPLSNCALHNPNSYGLNFRHFFARFPSAVQTYNLSFVKGLFWRLIPFMPTVAFNICCPRDCVSGHNGGAWVPPLNPSESIVLWEHYRLWGI